MTPVYKLSANSVKNGRTVYGSMLAGNTAYAPAAWGSWTQTTLYSSRNFPHVTFKNNIWMAPQFYIPGSPAGNYGENVVWISSNGSSWTSYTLPSSQQWRVPQYANGVWLMATDGTNYATSTNDGVSWTARTYAGLNAQPGDSSPSAMFWAGYGSYTGYYTTDGVSLTSKTHPVVNPIYGLYAFNKWFLFGTDNTYAYSTDGTATTWTTGTFATSGGSYAVGFNGTTMLVCQPGTTQAYTSTDGISWTSRTLPMNSEEGIVYSPTGGNFIIVSRSSTTAYTSPNGSTWTARNLPSGNANNTRGISASSTTYVVSTSSGSMSRITYS